MEAVFNDFKQALDAQNGYALASTISPIAPAHDAGRLYSFYRSSNAFSIQTDVRYAIIYNNDVHLTKAEGTAWLEVFVAYWKAIGEILAAEEVTNQGKNAETNWSKVYEAWKDMVNALIKGYQSAASFPAWTVPCLYTAGKYLRHFAIKADESAAKAEGNVTFNAGFQDDVVSAIGKHEKLEDAARQLQRIFSLCISDRYGTTTAAVAESERVCVNSVPQSFHRRITQMGHLLHRQSHVQDVLQGI